MSKQCEKCNRDVVDVFNDNVKNNPKEWIGLNESSDYTIDVDGLDKSKIARYKEEFYVQTNETILFLRDTSFFNNVNQGIVITDQALHLIRDNDHPENIQIIRWFDIQSILFDKDSNFFRITCGSKKYYIPVSFLVKPYVSLDEQSKERVAKWIVKLLRDMSDSVEKITQVDEEIVDDTLYFKSYKSVAKRNEMIPLLMRNFFKFDPNKGCKNKELSEYNEIVMDFEKMIVRINDIDKSIGEVQNGRQNILNSYQQMMLNRQVSRGFQPPTAQQAKGDLLFAGIYGLAALASKADERSLKKKQETLKRVYDIVSNNFYSDMSRYLAFYLFRISGTVNKLAHKYYDYMLNMSTRGDGLKFVEYEMCGALFYLYCKLRFQQQVIRQRLMEVNQRSLFNKLDFSIDDIVCYEVNQWSPQVFSMCVSASSKV